MQGIGFVASLFSQSDTDKLLDAIGKLQATLDADFAQLGDLIKSQTLMLSQNEDTLALAAALAHSSTGADKLDRFLRTKDQAELSTADTESDLGVQFFLNLPGT